MRAIQIVELGGPESLQLADIDEPAGDGVVIDVRACGVSFPEVLQSRGQYQLKPDLPFVPGSEVAGVVRADAHGFAAGERVAALSWLGGFAETVVAQPQMTFRLPDALNFAQGAGLILNYHTAHFSLVDRGRLRAGETVLVHGAAGGVGTASIQVAKGLGARVLAVVSSDAKAEVARTAGADEVLRSDGAWKDEAKALGGVDLVLDPVGGDRFTDSLRTLNPDGRLIVVGFTGGAIPEVKVNRLLLNNISVVGAGWGAYISQRPETLAETARALDALIESGHVRPLIGARFPLAEASRALQLIDGRGATGKVVLEP
ncbi:NADPH:quinone oxidoreductase family protein [Solirubrobacter sp. CPCC 204708]|uniref:NADPH:quinone oxidoreductase family protein n=1 Tax=Solirubrobacter deserti TaxID=2282478 RepID=A0ABT4RFE7_9ACTN|nr:NADPH:quinone oxidoreductase family protein [Solirubrobacter deserti]MBE2318577.1 NADPH:quinone oxidoreductase family protein [Solirubrobacter deserti]MDA0137035.1 NADPH:quinone oxidoreductase family protein [Solirubrobacter deserti]